MKNINLYKWLRFQNLKLCEIPKCVTYVQTGAMTYTFMTLEI